MEEAMALDGQNTHTVAHRRPFENYETMAIGYLMETAIGQYRQDRTRDDRSGRATSTQEV